MRGKLESVNKKMHMIRFPENVKMLTTFFIDLMKLLISDCAVHIFCSLVEKCKIDPFEKQKVEAVACLIRLAPHTITCSCDAQIKDDGGKIFQNWLLAGLDLQNV